MKKTAVVFDWRTGWQKVRTLSRSFDTLAEAQEFARDKLDAEIYRSKGKYKVEYHKVVNLE